MVPYLHAQGVYQNPSTETIDVNRLTMKQATLQRTQRRQYIQAQTST
jgi:hypothetical protein